MNSEKISISSPRRCAVVGYPIAHSLSPRLHAAFARQFSLNLDYQRIDCPPEQFASWVQDFFSKGGCGLNVTVPHKAAAFALARSHGADALAAQAANTLSLREGMLHADNTDGIGLCADLTRLGFNFENARLLLLGAGGAGAGIVPALLRFPVAQIVVHNRNAERAKVLQQRCGDVRVLIAGNNAGVLTQPFDLAISCLSAGFAAQMQSLGELEIAQAYDLNYGERAQESRQFAVGRAWVYHDGMGMLIEQAAASFRIWHGLQPDTTALHRGEY